VGIVLRARRVVVGLVGSFGARQQSVSKVGEAAHLQKNRAATFDDLLVYSINRSLPPHQRAYEFASVCLFIGWFVYHQDWQSLATLSW